MPKIFWDEDPYSTNRISGGVKQPPRQAAFYWSGFLLDLLGAVAVGISLGQWLQKRAESPAAASAPPPTPAP